MSIAVETTIILINSALWLILGYMALRIAPALVSISQSLKKMADK